MQQFNYPTTILYGEGSIKEMAKRISERGLKKPLVVTDTTLEKVGIVGAVLNELKEFKLQPVVFNEVHPNPIEDDVDKGAASYLKNKCDSVIAIGGGSPMDAAKVIMVAATHPKPLEQYDDAIGGDRLIKNEMPPLFAITTTAGTGSEVGRAGVIIMKASGEKTIFFHPKLLPSIAVLEPKITKDLPAHLTAATGIDAFTHCLEAFFAKGFHPIADGVAVEGMRLVIKNLPLAVKNGGDLEARGHMLLAASMGAAAFQKGLGMIHSLAHPLSSECGLHHGLANALMLPTCVAFLESSNLNADQKERIERVQKLFAEKGLAKGKLSETCFEFFKSLGIQFGLKNHGVKKEQIDILSKKAFKDGCHQTNMIPVTEAQLKAAFEKAF